MVIGLLTSFTQLLFKRGCQHDPCFVGTFCRSQWKTDPQKVPRRLMRNCEQRGRSREFMLAPNLLPKAVPHDGSRLLLGLIVRPRGRLVEGRPSLECASQGWPSCPPFRERGPYPGHPRPVASLPQREGFLALRVGPPAPLLPEVVLPGPAQSAHPSPCARAARVAARLRPRARRAFGRLSGDGHHSRSGYREGEGFSQGALLRAGYLREERFQDRVDLRLQGGVGGGPRRGDHGLRPGTSGLRR